MGLLSLFSNKEPLAHNLFTSQCTVDFKGTGPPENRLLHLL